MSKALEICIAKKNFRVDVRLPSVVQTPRRKAKMKNGENLPNINKKYIENMNKLLQRCIEKYLNRCYNFIKGNDDYKNKELL